MKDGLIEVVDAESLDSFPEILNFFEGDLEAVKLLVESVPKAIQEMIKASIPKKFDAETKLEIDKQFESLSEAYSLVTDGKQKLIEFPTKNKTASKVFREMTKHWMLERSILNMSLVYLVSKFENFANAVCGVALDSYIVLGTIAS